MDKAIGSERNIVFASGTFPPAVGGPATILAALIPELQKGGWRATVLTFGKEDTRDRGYPVRRVPLSTPRPLRLLRVLWQTIGAARNSQILYAFDTYTHGVAARLACGLLRKILIVRFTGDSAWESAFNRGETTEDVLTFQRTRCSMHTTLLKWRRNWILRGADRIITDCVFLKNLLESIGMDPAKIAVIANPVPEFPLPLRFDPELERATRNRSGPVLLSMGRLVAWKGVAALIRVLPRLIPKFPEPTLLIAGYGPQESELKRLSRELNLGSSVKFLGPIEDPKKKQKLYTTADVVVQNTFYEGMSNTLLEAMSFGKPIVTTRSGGNAELIHETNAVVVGYNQEDQIEHALLNLLSDPLRAAHLGKMAKESVQGFTLTAFVEKHIAVLQTLIREHAQ